MNIKETLEQHKLWLKSHSSRATGNARRYDKGYRETRRAAKGVNRQGRASQEGGVIASNRCSIAFNRIFKLRTSPSWFMAEHDVMVTTIKNVIANQQYPSKKRSLSIYLKTTWSRSVINATAPIIIPPKSQVKLFVSSFLSNIRSFLVAKPSVTCISTSTCASACLSVTPDFVRVLAALCVSKAVAVIGIPSLFMSLFLENRPQSGGYQA